MGGNARFIDRKTGEVKGFANKIDLTKVEELVGDRVDMEVYSNPYKLKVITTKTHKNIFTKEEI